MPQVTEVDVRQIIETCIEDLSPFIATAEQLSNYYLLDQGIPDSLMFEIQRWLSAHFVAISDDKQRATERKTGESSASFGGDLGRGLDFTRYGQQAVLLDPSGQLAAVSGGKTARFSVIKAPTFDSYDSLYDVGSE